MEQQNNIWLERWCQVGDLPYFVSDQGRVKNSAGLILRLHTGDRNYRRVKFRIEGVRVRMWVHRLVALAYCHRPEDSSVVVFRDGNRGNCHWANLEWISHAEMLKRSGNFGRAPKRK
jgi:hypothetical protein